MKHTNLRRIANGSSRPLAFESLEPLVMLANGTATVEIVSAPSTVRPNALVDVTVRYRLTGNDRGGPWEVKQIALYDQDAVFDDKIVEAIGSISQQNTWVIKVFRNVNLSRFDDAGDGVELYARVVINDNQANFADATDNSPVRRVRVGEPDLRVKSLTLSDRTVSPGDEIEIDAVVRNFGTADADRSTVRYYFGDDEGSRSTFIGEGVVPNIGVLSPDEESKDSPTAIPQPNFEIPNVASGTYYITAVADATRKVAESNESNNELSVSITVGEVEEPTFSAQTRLTCAMPSGPGVTIITHGFAGGSGSGAKTPDWTIEMAEAVLRRRGEPGSVFVHDPVSSQWVIPESRGLPKDIWPGRVARTNSNHSDEEIVLVFDWTHESDDSENGWQEAAADSLFANLVAPFTAMGNVLDLLTRPLHFIGHSRGTIVNSLVAHRLGWHFPGHQITQFTTLDPHPSVIHGDPGALQQRLAIPRNIHWADNYYRQDGSYEADLDFNGVPVPGSRNLELNEDVLGSGVGHLAEHSDVHLWYLATINPASPFAEGETVTDPEFDDWWRSGTAFHNAIEPRSGRANVGFARSRIGGAPLNLEQMDRSQLQTPRQTASVFNGDFEKGDAVFNEIPGWERHGGGGSGSLNSRDGNNYLQLSTFGRSRRHNDFYIPQSVTEVEFDYWINNNDGLNTNDVLEVVIGNEVTGSISLGQETAGFVRNHVVSVPAEYRGTSTTLEFRIGGSGGIDSEVRIDNVRLVGVEQGLTSTEMLDLVHAAVVERTSDLTYDWNEDGRVNSRDAERFLSDCMGSRKGDANGDRRVDFVDFLALSSNFGRTDTQWSEGDFDFNGTTDFADFLLLSSEFGQHDSVI